VNIEQRRWLADYFSPADLIELLDIDTYDLICALEEFDGDNIFDDSTIADLNEIVGVGY
jgi:hypothetical protein